ncbi:MAG: DUF5615 family PIN-like protein [Candidatus Aenigmatarchaeota archaeon]
MRFLADEHIDIHAVDALKQMGIDIVSVQELDKRSQSDEELLAFANQDGRTVITRDEDFLRLHAKGMQHHGIVFLTKRLDASTLVREVLKVSMFELEQLKNAIVFIPIKVNE